MLTTLYFQCLFVLFCPSFYDPLFFTLNKTIYLLPFLFLICIPFLSSSSWRCPCQCGLVFYDSNGVGSSLPAPLQLQFIYNLLHPVAKGKARTTLSGPFTWGKKKNCLKIETETNQWLRCLIMALRSGHGHGKGGSGAVSGITFSNIYHTCKVFGIRL